jgi:hypothetical protein
VIRRRQHAQPPPAACSRLPRLRSEYQQWIDERAEKAGHQEELHQLHGGFTFERQAGAIAQPQTRACKRHGNTVEKQKPPNEAPIARATAAATPNTTNSGIRNTGTTRNKIRNAYMLGAPVVARKAMIQIATDAMMANNHDIRDRLKEGPRIRSLRWARADHAAT